MINQVALFKLAHLANQASATLSSKYGHVWFHKNKMAMTKTPNWRLQKTNDVAAAMSTFFLQTVVEIYSPISMIYSLIYRLNILPYTDVIFELPSDSAGP